MSAHENALLLQGAEKIDELRAELERLRVDVREVAKEMRERKIGRRQGPSMTLWNWADRLERSIGDRR